MNIFTWFFNLFRSNKTLFRFAIQDIAWRLFEKRPQMKPHVLQAINTAFAQVTANTLARDIPALIKANIQATNLAPPEKQLVNDMIDAVVLEWISYKVKEDLLTEAQQYQSIAEVMGWIRDMAR